MDSTFFYLYEYCISQAQREAFGKALGIWKVWTACKMKGWGLKYIMQVYINNRNSKNLNFHICKNVDVRIFKSTRISILGTWFQTLHRNWYLKSAYFIVKSSLNKVFSLIPLYVEWTDVHGGTSSRNYLVCVLYFYKVKVLCFCKMASIS